MSLPFSLTFKSIEGTTSAASAKTFANHTGLYFPVFHPSGVFLQQRDPDISPAPGRQSRVTKSS
jgi:hypothetical protein